MKTKLLSILLLPALLLTLVLPVYASDGVEEMARLDTILYLIRTTGLDFDPSMTDEDLLRQGLQKLFAEDPESFNKVMDAILSSQDSHSMYIPAGTYDEAFAESVSYVGIGITMEQAGDLIRIKAVNEDGPAWKAGVRPGDFLISVGTTALTAADMPNVASMVRGEAGTKVTIGVRRGSQALSFTITRAAIVVPNLTGEVLEQGIYYMDLNRFDSSAIYGQFTEAMTELQESGSEVLILDLRGNPGGELAMVMYFLNRLIPDEDVEYFAIAGRPTEQSANRRVYVSSGLGPDLRKIILLTDGDSASASEVMTSSLHDLGYAVTVGQTTYGKARGQQHLIFEEDGAAAVLTTVRLIPPSGIDYEGVGLTPDHVVDNYAAKHPAASCRPLDFKLLSKGDRGYKLEQLQKALQALGYLDAACTETTFGGKILDAVNAFRADMGLGKMTYLNAQTINLINSSLEALADTTITVDAQLGKALELAREYLK